MKRISFFILFLLVFSTLSAQKNLSEQAIKWIPFEWADPDLKDAILVRTKLDTLPYIFNWQLDTGSPYTFVYGATVKMFAVDYPVILDKIKRSDTVSPTPYYHIFSPAFTVNDTTFLPNIIMMNDNAGGGFPQEYIQKYKGARFDIGTMGLDICKNRVLIINFKNNSIGFADRLSVNFYTKTLNTTSFQLYKNRIVLPVKIGSETYPFFYDCGASMFAFQTTAGKSKAFAPKVLRDTLYDINNIETGAMHNVAGGTIEKPVRIGNKKYSHVKVYVEPSPSAIFDEAKVVGLIGNKLFLNHVVVIDFINSKFTVLE